MNNSLYALILAGGKGRRLWPKSKGTCPKYLFCFNSDFSLLQETFSRLNGFLPQEQILVVTTEKQKASIKRQLPHLKPDNLIIEPQGKNTLPCILLAAILIKKRFPDATVVVLPSDHFIKPVSNFLASIKQAIKFVQKEDAIVTVGIKPTYPATGYGYIKIKSKIKTTPAVRGYPESKIYKVERFIEKPPLEKAEKFLCLKNFFWNGGVFVFKISKILEESKRFVPSMYKAFGVLENINSKIKFNSTLNQIYKNIPAISIDQAILEKSGDIFMMEADFSWYDLGSWECLANIFMKDKNNNVNLGKNFLYKTNNSIIFNEENNHLVATLGLEDLVAIHTPEVTLIYPKYKSQELKNLVNLLEKDKRFRKYL